MRTFEIASELVKATCVHVLPASVDLYTPSPGMMLPRMHDSPVPMNTMSGFDSETATAPTDEVVIWPSVTGVHDRPPSIVFHNPPPTAPKYPSFGRPFTPDTAIDRPPRSGPMLRQRMASRIALSMVDSAPCASARAGRTPAPHAPATIRKTAELQKTNR